MKTRLLLAACVTVLFASFGICGATAQTEANHAQAPMGHEHKWNMDHPQFDEHERAVTRDWYRDHREHLPPGFRDRDMLTADMDKQLQPNFMLTTDFRKRAFPVPGDLYKQLPVPPPGYHYKVIGGRLCLVDPDWRVHDVIRFQLAH